MLGDTHRIPNGDQDWSLAGIAAFGLRQYMQDDRNWFYSVESATIYEDSCDCSSIAVTPGFTYGRFIRATALARAIRIDEFLLVVLV